LLITLFPEDDLAPQPTLAPELPHDDEDLRHVALIAPLSASDRLAVQKTWNVPEHSRRIVASSASGAGGSLVHVLDMHMWRMRCGWLYDECINAYMWLLQRQDNELCDRDQTRRRCHFFSSFFFDKVGSW
jgi:hypothetical protein